MLWYYTFILKKFKKQDNKNNSFLDYFLLLAVLKFSLDYNLKTPGLEYHVKIYTHLYSFNIECGKTSSLVSAW